MKKIMVLILVCLVQLLAKIPTTDAATNLVIQQRAMVETHAGTVQDQNNLVIPATIAEENERAVNDIYLATLRDGWQGMSPERQNILFDIAHQCPYTGGLAVFRAQVLYDEWVSDTVEYDYDLVCLAQGIFRQSNIAPAIESPVTFLLHPNPAGNSVTIVYSGNQENSCTLVIMDLAGKAVQTISLPCAQTPFTFNTENLKEGLYIVKLFSNEQLIGQSKLGIIK